MIRNFNYTGRGKIELSRININLVRDDEGSPRFVPRINLEGLDLPPDAHVFVEAYYRAAYMRFDFGTVHKIRMPKDTHLREIDSEGVVYFRVKVTTTVGERGLILAVADRIKVLEPKERPANRLCLLDANFCDLGDEIWRVVFEEGDPVVEINSRIEGIREIARSGEFVSLVYPAIFGQVFNHIIVENGYDDPQGDNEIWNNWFRFVSNLPGMSELPKGSESGEKQEWIEQAVSAFCSEHKIRKKFVQALRG